MVDSIFGVDAGRQVQAVPACTPVRSDLRSRRSRMAGTRGAGSARSAGWGSPGQERSWRPAGSGPDPAPRWIWNQSSRALVASSRRRAESNRCTRLCRPLPNHSATSPDRQGYQRAGVQATDAFADEKPMKRSAPTSRIETLRKVRRGADTIGLINERLAQPPPKLFIRFSAAGPSATTNIEGKMKITVGNSILTGAFIAFSSAASCRRRRMS